jgi:hypothetical protein
MKFCFSGPLLRFVNYRKEIEVEAETLGTAFEKLVQECPLLSSVIRDGDGNVLSAHRLFLSGRLIKDPDPAMGLRNTDTIEVLTSIAGG